MNRDTTSAVARAGIGAPPRDMRRSPDPFVTSASYASVLAIDRVGTAIVTATQPEGSKWRVVSFVRTAGSAQWRGAIDISGPERDTGTPDLAANDAGQAVAAWTGVDGALPVTRAALRRADGTWGAPENLGYAGSYRGPYAAIDGRGNAVVLWTRAKSDGTSDVYTEFRAVEGRWEPAVVLSGRGVDFGNAGVVMNRRGDALAVWGERDDSGGVALVSSLRRAGASSWEPASRIPISSPATALYAYGGLSFALDAAGNATLVVQRADGYVEAVMRALDAGGWEGAVVLGNGGDGNAWYTRDSWCVDPRVALDAAGGVTAIWGGAALYSARRRPGSQAWEKPVVVAPGPVCFTRALAVDPDGNAVAIWNASKDAVTRLDAAILDATPPVLSRLVLPRVARTGRRVRFSVAASDLWSSLARPPLWRFGDGARMRGMVVHHVYRRPGRYRVSVIASDKGGNNAMSTATVRVSGDR